MRDFFIFSLTWIMINSSLHASNASISINNLDEFLTNQEAQVSGIMEGAQKTIKWYDNSVGTKREYTILYFHGYSSSRQEIDPVPQIVANALQANLFYTRFKGHGIKGGGHAFKGVIFEDWINDAEEAMTIAQLLGKHVIIIAHSNGAVMAMHLMHRYPSTIKAGLFVAPNFRPKNPAAALLTTQWGYKLATLIYKDSLYSTPSEPKNLTTSKNLFTEVWSNSQHLDATKALAIGVQRLKKYPIETMHVPLFIVASDFDKLVDTTYTKKIFMRYGIKHKTPKKMIIENNTQTPGEHTITGQYTAPHTSELFAKAMIDFIIGLDT